MLKMAGIRVHPAARILIGGVVIAIGLLRHGAAALVVGGVLIVWGVAAALGHAGGEPDQARASRR